MSEVKLTIDVPADLIAGAFANAFRILPDSNGDFFLDFCAYSESDQRGTVVARVRVRSVFIPFIRDRLSATLLELGGAAPVHEESPFFLKGEPS